MLSLNIYFRPAFTTNRGNECMANQLTLGHIVPGKLDLLMTHKPDMPRIIKLLWSKYEHIHANIKRTMEERRLRMKSAKEG